MKKESIAMPRGPLAWMASNSVASNLLMLLLVVGGLVFAFQVKKEVFPEVTMDMVTVSVSYPGAGPDEVESAITLAVEDAVRGVDGVKNVSSTSSEGSAQITIELMTSANPDQSLNNIKSAIDRIASFPQNAERPVVSLATMRSQILTLVIAGDLDPDSLRQVTDKIKLDLEQLKSITTVELAGAAPREISIEVSHRDLRAYGLTLNSVAATIRAGSVETPGGELRTTAGGILLRTTERRMLGSEFADLILINNKDGTNVRLGDVATVIDGFEDTQQSTRFNGQPALLLKVFSVGNQTPLDIAEAVNGYVDIHDGQLGNVRLFIWDDSSEAYKGRQDLLVNNALLGLGLVMLVLGLFLDIRLAFWVTLGIPISFLGSFIFFPAAGVSLNMISMFAFILTLGIVVDDAIVIGEAVHARRSSGMSAPQAAIAGVRDVAKPVIFSVLTSVAAFSPLLFIPGVMGKFFSVVPTVVIVVLLLSLVEALLILPAHLSHENREYRGLFGSVHRAQQRFSQRFEKLSQRLLRPVVEFATQHRLLVYGGAIGSSLLIVAMVAGGRVPTTFMPTMSGDVVTATLTMPYGTPLEVTEKYETRIRNAAKEVLEEMNTEFGASQSRGMLSMIGSTSAGSGPRAGVAGSGAHLAEVSVLLSESTIREATAEQLAERWRIRVGEIPGIESMFFEFETGIGAGADISVQLSHSNQAILEEAAQSLARSLSDYQHVTSVKDGFGSGKEQLNFTLEPAAHSLGLTASELGRQVRDAFYGAEALRQIRGRDEIRVMVRLPKAERSTLESVEKLLIRTRSGGEVPLSVAAKVVRNRSVVDIQRRNGQRVATVEARVNGPNTATIMGKVQSTVLPALKADYPGLTSGQAGQQEQQAESLDSLKTGFFLAIFVMYALLAVPLKSYIQPLIIMSAIPFGVTGAIAGHIIMGFSLSLMSVMGIVAVAGVVVNDSLVLLTTINQFRQDGMSVRDSAVQAALRRFRPIMLTSLTTFVGLAPMLLETSTQARFLVPMAISVAFGVAFSTAIILLMVPALYVSIESRKEK